MNDFDRDENLGLIRVVICRSNPIDPDPRVEKTARALIKVGYKVIIIAWDRTSELPIESQVGDISLIRLPIRAEFGHGLQNLPNLLRWQWGLLWWLINNRDSYDVIHACDFDTVIPAILVKKLWGKCLVYDIFDFYADHLRATPDSLKKIVRAVDIKSISNVDALILADDSRWEQIKGAHPIRSVVIYNSPEDVKNEFSGGELSRNKNEIHLSYVGLLQVERGLLKILEVMKSHTNWFLNLAGFGGDQEQILAIAKELPNVKFHGRVSYEQALRLNSSADVLIATYDPEIPNHKYSSPNKVFEAMMLGKPIIVANNTNMDRIVTQSDCGITVDYGDKEALVLCLMKLQQDIDLRINLGINARKAYENKYSWANMETRLENLYGEITAVLKI